MRFSAWLALLAMMALALVPTVSHALAASRGAVTWAEVCTPQGTRVVAFADQPGEQTAPPAMGGHLEHCAFCAMSFGALGLPPAPQPGWISPLNPAELPALFLHAPRTLFAWTRAQPRAPPVWS